MTDTKIDEIVALLRQRILNGEFGISGRIPPVRVLAEQYTVSRETANKAIHHLQSEGLLFSEGRSIYVRIPPTRISGGITARFDLHLQAQGLTPIETNVEEPVLVPAPEPVAKAFGIEKDTLVVRRVRRQGTTNTHYRIAENFYPTELVGEDILAQMQQDSRYDVLLAIKENHGLIIERVHEDVTGRLPTDREQDLLNITRTTPVLEMVRMSSSENHVPIMFNTIIFVAHYFVLSYDYTTQHWKDMAKQ